LETEVQELYAKLRQGSSYTAELKKRFEESLKAMYRHSKNPSVDVLKDELDRLGAKLAAVENEVQKSAADLAGEKMSSRRRHASLIDDLVRALQAKDAAVHAVKKLESLCIESGLEHITVYKVHIFPKIFTLSFTDNLSFQFCRFFKSDF
jgi:FMN-dependent NADH-azoreductase